MTGAEYLLLAALAIPAFKRVTERTEHTTISNDLRIFVAAFEQYSLENGIWPADGTAGVLPVEMEDSISVVKWSRGAAAGGGNWKWDLGQAGVAAAIELNNCTFAEERLVRLDALIDDGNTGTGAFRKRSTGDPMWVLAE